MIKVAINGFGRIGRLAARKIFKDFENKLELVAVNTSGRMETEGWAHLLKYDTVYGKIKLEVKSTKSEVRSEIGKIKVGDHEIVVLAEREPAKIPWGDYGAELVIEATGVFRKEEELKGHLRDSVKKVVLSAPPKSENIPMIILGVNEEAIGSSSIVSCASCTTNCAAPVAKVVLENFGIKEAMLTTVHAYTDDQRLQDNSHKDLRRARAAAQNMVPTSTGAAEAVCKIIPELKGKFKGMAVRVPVICGSLVDFTFITEKPVGKEEVNKVFRKAAETQLQGILAVSNEPLVSSDIVATSFSALVDLSLTEVVGDNLLKIVAWYDNEWGYVCRLVELVEKICNL